MLEQMRRHAASSIYGEPVIDMFVRARRLQWLGCIERMEEGRTVKRVAVKRQGLESRLKREHPTRSLNVDMKMNVMTDQQGTKGSKIQCGCGNLL